MCERCTVRPAWDREIEFLENFIRHYPDGEQSGRHSLLDKAREALAQLRMMRKETPEYLPDSS